MKGRCGGEGGKERKGGERGEELMELEGRASRRVGEEDVKERPRRKGDKQLKVEAIHRYRYERRGS